MSRRKDITCCIHAADNFFDPDKRIEEIEGQEKETMYMPHRIKEGELMSQHEPYVFSPCNEKDKYSYDYVNCTGIIGIGFNPEMQKEISFLSHQHPLLYKSKRYNPLSFEKHLRQKIREIMSLTDNQTLEIGIFGGNNIKDDLI